jgi:subtilisin family serine protease
MRARFVLIALLIAFASGAFSPTLVTAQTSPSATAPSSLIVKVVAGLTTDQQAEIVARNGGTLTSSIPALRLLIVAVAPAEVDATLARYHADSQVQNVELNKTRTSEAVPNDPLYVNQWALPKIGWDQVFGVITPTGSAKVALLDTGVDASHPELAGKVVPGTSILDGSNGMTDPSGHGTWLAGIIAAQTDTLPVQGIAALAYAGVQIVPVTVLNANGEGQDSDVIAGVLWAADHGADVILMAFSAPDFSQNLQDAIDYAWSKGVVVVAAVGNNAVSTPTFPAGDRGVMGVAATDPSDALAPFSNAGQAVFIAAPGVDIQTIDLNGNYIVISGTSTSAAYVAGLAAFMKAVDPTLSNGVIVGRIARNADPAGTQDQTGNGRINMPRALADTSTEFIEPAGAAPVGAGGPFVGPYRAAAVTSVSPNSGPIAGGTAVTISGSSFASGGAPYTALFGGTSVSATRVDSNTLTATTPAHAAGPVTVEVRDKNNNSQGSLANGFTYFGPPAKLAFTTQPSNGTAGVALGTQPAVTVQDAGGNKVTNATNSITLAIATNPSSGTLSVTSNPLSATAGVATFAGVSIDQGGTGYTLQATAAGLTSATSNPFDISQMRFTSVISPTSATFGDTKTYTVTITNTSIGGSGGPNMLGCAKVSVPAGFGTPTSLSVNASGNTWTTPTVSGGVISTNAVNSGNRVDVSQTVAITFTAPATAAGTQTWTTSAFNTTGCAGPFAFSGTQPSVTVNPAPVTVNITGGPFTFDGASHAATVTTNPVIAGFTVNYAGTTTAYNSSTAPTNADTYTVTVAITDPNYVLSGSGTGSITINKKNLTISGAVAQNKPYDGNNSATVDLSTASLVGVVSPNVVTISSSGYTATFNNKNVGASKPVTVSGVTLSGADAGNYTVSQPSGLTANITAKNLTITGAVAQNKQYDGITNATVDYSTASLVGVIAPEMVSINSSGYTATFNNKNVGTSKPVTAVGLTLSGTDAPNYTVSQPSGLTANIAALHITGSFTALDKQYDGTTAATVLTRSLNGAIVGDAVSLSGGTATFADKNVGAGKTVTLTGATLAGADAGNYVLDSVATTTASITAKHITGSFTAPDKQYDGTTAATVLTRSLNGAIVGDDVSLSGGTATFVDKNVGVGKTVTLTGATLTGADTGNYVLDSVATTTASITVKHITGNFTAQDRQYDGTTAATVLTRSLTGVISPDVVNLTGGTATFADKNVGIGKTVTLTGATLAGADAGNYVLDSVAPATASITAKHITGSFTAPDKQYDGTTAATVLSRSLSGAVAGDLVSLSGGTATFADKNVGAGKTVTLTGATLAGADAGNYVLDSVATAPASITVKHITGSFTAPDKQYDGTTAAIVLTRSLNGAVVGDIVSLSGGTATFADKNVGPGKTVTLTGAILQGADAGNYVLDSVGTTTASITAKHITGSFTTQDKVYNGTVGATVLTRSLSGAITGDTVSLSGGTATSADKNVGAGKTVTLTGATLTGADAGNYVLDSVATATASITPATVTASVTAANKTFDGTTTATITACTLSGVVAGDTGSVTCAAGSASFSDANPGANKTVTATGITLSGAAAGNYQLSSTTATTTASITYGFVGLQSPYAPPSDRAFKVKSTIPLKWQYTNVNGVVVPSPNAAPTVDILTASCSGLDGTQDVVAEDAGASGYQYDATTNTWQFNWKTTGLAAGCYNIRVNSGLTSQTTGPFLIQLVR